MAYLLLLEMIREWKGCDNKTVWRKTIMNKWYKKISCYALAFVFCFPFAGKAHATSFGTDITVSDGKSSGTGWYSDREDNEVEPGMVTNQTWDLEGVFVNSSNELSIVGGYNFLLGQSNMMSGDIFIDIDGNYGWDATSDPVLTPPTTTGTELWGADNHKDNFGYEYVLDLDFDLGEYIVRELDTNSYTTSVYYPHNERGSDPTSNPWRYLKEENQGIEAANIVETGSFSFLSGLTNAEAGFLGDNTNNNHYAITGFNLNFLDSLATSLGRNIDYTVHFTMECGNDNILGQGHAAPVPEPTTMLLLVTGLVGLAGVSRKRK